MNMEKSWWRSPGGEVLVEKSWWRSPGGEVLVVGGEFLYEVCRDMNTKHQYRRDGHFPPCPPSLNESSKTLLVPHSAASRILATIREYLQQDVHCVQCRMKVACSDRGQLLTDQLC